MSVDKTETESSATGVAIRIHDLHKSFGDNQVLKGIDLEILRGRITTIIGGSGSGKSVLVKHLIGLLRPDNGSIIVDGEDITRLTERELLKVRRKFGMLFQHSALFDSMTVEDNIAFPLVEHTRHKRSKIREIVAEKLDLLHLAGHEKKWPAELSGGMRKRVALARAIVLNPQFLIYDEPTTGLDPILCSQVDEMIAEAQEKLGVTSIIISHDMASTFRLAHRIAMLYDGKIIASDEPRALAESGIAQVDRFIRESGVTLEAIRA